MGSLKRFNPTIRSLHVYLSLTAFGLLLFFSVTGWLMAHQETFGLNEPVTTEETISLKERPDLLMPEKRADLLLELGLSGRLTENEAEFFQLQSPGQAVWVELNSDTSEITIVHETRGLIGGFFDLHRNRNTGGIGIWIQDLTAGLCLLVSLTGIYLWIPLRRRRTLGLATLTGGLLLLALWITWA